MQEDEDVARERFRILQANEEDLLESEVLVMRELRKVYPGSRGLGVVAVDRTTMGIVGGECFGLLGINGAGKTTTFKMLTGDEAVTSGEAFVDGFSIKYNLRQVLLTKILKTQPYVTHDHPSSVSLDFALAFGRMSSELRIIQQLCITK